MSILPLLMLGVGVLVAIALLVFAFAGPSVDKAKIRRLTAVKDRHVSTTGAVVEAQMRRIQAGRQSKMDGFAARIIPNPALLKIRLSKTGKTWTPAQYLMASVAIAVVVGVIAYSKLHAMPGAIAASLFAGLLMGLAIPHFAINYLAGRRLAQFYKRFPDAIELLVRGLRSGLPITETLQVVASEVPGPVGEEFRNVVDKVRIGKTLDGALQETADRLGTPEFQFFCITLAIQRETGGNLAETLQNLATVLRQRAQMKMKIKAMSSESKASAYIIGSLPFIVFFLINQINATYMTPFFTNPQLTVVGLGGLCWMAIGAFIMKKMISFEI